MINSETGLNTKIVQYITICSGVRGTEAAPLELQVERNAAPVVYKAAGTQEIILD